MVKRWLLAALLSVATLGTVAAPSAAARVWGHVPHRRMWHRHWHRRVPYRYYRGYPLSWTGHRRQVADRAWMLYRQRRLNRSHYDRTIAKLRMRADRRWAEAVNRTLSIWSRADRRR